jgi:hypothetical protein
MEKHELTAGRIALIAATIGLITACVYLAAAVGAMRASAPCEQSGVRATREAPRESRSP